MNWFGFPGLIPGLVVPPQVDLGIKMTALAKRYMAELIMDEIRREDLPNLADDQYEAVRDYAERFAEDLRLEAGQTGADEWHAARQPKIPISEERV